MEFKLLFWSPSAVLSDPSRRQEYDEKGMLYVNDFNIVVWNFHHPSSHMCNLSVLELIFSFCRIISSDTKALFWLVMASVWSIQFGKIEHSHNILRIFFGPSVIVWSDLFLVLRHFSHLSHWTMTMYIWHFFVFLFYLYHMCNKCSFSETSSLTRYIFNFIYWQNGGGSLLKGVFLSVYCTLAG